MWISPNITLFSGSIHNTAVCVSISCIPLFFWMKEITFNWNRHDFSVLYFCVVNIYSGVHFWGENFGGTFYLWELIFLDCWKKNAKIANIRNCQSFVSHSSLPNFLSYGAPLMHVSHYSSAITQRPTWNNDGWIANIMLLCPYEIESKLSLYYHPCRVNISQKDFKLICGVLCGPIKLWLHELSLEEI